MTFVIKTRGAGGFLVAEYRCSVHGVFERIVQRDASGDVWDSVPCLYILDDSGDRDLDHLPSSEEEEDPNVTFCCGISPWTPSAPKPRVVSIPCFATVRGGDTERRPGMLDTRGLADGSLTHDQWKAKQRDGQRDRRHKQLVDKGIVSKKIQVG